jgi:hypothetical protein
MQQILATENETGSVSVSGLGYLTMLNDYGAQLAWKFETPTADESAVPQVTTLVRLPV